MEGNNQNNSYLQGKLKKFSLFVWEIIKIAFIAFIIVAPIRYFIFQPFIVSGASMEPNFHNGDYLIVDELSYRFVAPQRGDVVVFHTDFIPDPKYKKDRFIKRIIGLPGDTVDIENGQIKVISNGKTEILNEKYLPSTLKTYEYDMSAGYNISSAPKEIQLKEKEYFVLGDNRANSYDSRFWGVLPEKYIIGRTMMRLLPITSISLMQHPNYQ